jgi:hypothetical protein
MVVECLPCLASILLGCERLDMLPCALGSKTRMEDGLKLLQVSEKGRGKRTIGLEGLLFFGVIGVISHDRGTGSRLHVN